jgi:hypothetical protein
LAIEGTPERKVQARLAAATACLLSKDTKAEQWTTISVLNVRAKGSLRRTCQPEAAEARGPRLAPFQPRPIIGLSASDQHAPKCFPDHLLGGHFSTTSVA